MISIEPSNRIVVSLSGMTERSIVLDRSSDTIAMKLVPFLRGSDALWVTMTQAAYDALPQKDPKTLYLITG